VWSIGPSVSLPIFKGGQLRANLQKAKARYEELVATYRKSILTAYVDVEDSLTDLHMRAEEADAQTKALDAAREYAHLTRIQYQAGLVDYLHVVSAEQSLLNSELAVANVNNQRRISTVLLIKALGGGWTVPSSETEFAREPSTTSKKGTLP
jgi:multidrug efflux system outer membrane protein